MERAYRSVLVNGCDKKSLGGDKTVRGVGGGGGKTTGER